MTQAEEQFLTDLHSIHFSKEQKIAEMERGAVSVEFVLGVALSQRQPQARYCAWIMSHYVQKHKNSLTAYADRAIAFLPQAQVSGHIREILHWFTVGIPHEAERVGELFDFCLHALRSQSLPTGVKTYALAVSELIVCRYPELSEEYKEFLRDVRPYVPNNVARRIQKILASYR
ncbi:MAG: hypothetical protein LBU90_10210 [Bacteroidales bacterium]|nr:hypothetical protein [Bacteroidales bacterium]